MLLGLSKICCFINNYFFKKITESGRITLRNVSFLMWILYFILSWNFIATLFYNLDFATNTKNAWAFTKIVKTLVDGEGRTPKRQNMLNFERTHSQGESWRETLKECCDFQYTKWFNRILIQRKLFEEKVINLVKWKFEKLFTITRLRPSWFLTHELSPNASFCGKSAKHCDEQDHLEEKLRMLCFSSDIKKL